MDKGILFLVPEMIPDKGGLARSAFRVSRIFLRLGYRVTIVKLKRILPGGKAGRVKNRVSAFYGGARFLEFFFVPGHMEETIACIRKAVPRGAFDLIVSFYLNETSCIAARLKQLYAAPLITSARGNDINCFFLNNGHTSYAWFRSIVKSSDRLVFVTEDLKEKLNFYYPEAEGKSYVIRNSFDPSLYRWDKAALKPLMSRKRLMVGSVGELTFKKGADLLMRCLKLVKEEKMAKILLVGNHLDHRKKSYGFRSTGPIPFNRILSHIGSLDIVFFCSRADGCSNSAIEAMALGKVVIASDIPAFREMITDGYDGFLLDFTRPKEVACLVKGLLGRREKIKAIGLNAQKTVSEKFSLSKETSDWKELLRGVLS